ncbi:hypothetical protein P879_07974 [Paragonimus westermani]|uniref:non-specific serine/threonine protein kinase n=1 Tax=Paragonimus westermani TaxID=34504 RepID=A0A8T0D0R9_9TREM|nr:hypothetical protein P879_07974 [Paragonimus westermani]
MLSGPQSSDLRIEQSLPAQGTTKEPDQHVHRKNQGLTTFERIQIEFDKRHQFRSEKKYGKRIGFYRLILDIGRGNFAKVKLATHTLLNTEVAVKVIDRTKFDAKTRKLLSQELANMERLNHPNIIQVFEVHELFQRWYLVMEYAPVGELHSYLKRHGRMEENAAKNITAQIVSAVKHMHDFGVVHRDLKAENILFLTTTYVKVGDFGFSKKIQPDDALTTFCGSPPYAAPELFVADSYEGPAVDLWALGVLIFYMVVGQLPFRGDSISKIKRLVLDGTYTIPTFVKPACEELITGLLCRAVEKRFQINQVQESTWFAGKRWSELAENSKRSTNQIDDAPARELLHRWWNVDDWELQSALQEGPKNALTGIYRILRLQGKKFQEGKNPMTLKKRHTMKKTKENKTFPSDLENSKRTSRKHAVRHSEEVTTVDLRDQKAMKGKIEKENEHTSKTCAII